MNSTKVVTRLNADLLDGLQGTAFQRVTAAKCPQWDIAQGGGQQRNDSCTKIAIVETPIGNLRGSAQCPTGTRVISDGYSLPFVGAGGPLNRLFSE